MTQYSTESNTHAIKNWLFGTACGIALTVSLAAGTGYLHMNRGNGGHPAAEAIQRVVPATDAGLVPPPIDEMQQDRQSRAAAQVTATASTRMIPPPIDAFRSDGISPSSAENDTESPPQPINGSTKY